jgi:hypothetical protein
MADYLDLRHSLGHALSDVGWLLPSFVTYLDEHSLSTVTVAAALEWAQTSPTGKGTSVGPRRITAARGFAHYLAGIDENTEVPGDQVSLSAGSTGRCSGRSRFTLSRNQRIDPVQPIRSANTVAGMSGTSASRARTRGSNTANDVGPDLRSYFGGASDFTALMTVVRETPSRCAIRAFGTPSAANLLISAQSSKVITPQSLSAHFSPPKLLSFRAPPTDVKETAELDLLWGGRGFTDRDAGRARRSGIHSEVPQCLRSRAVAPQPTSWIKDDRQSMNSELTCSPDRAGLPADSCEYPGVSPQRTSLH